MFSPLPVNLHFSVNDLLSFEKMEAGIMTLHKSDVHVQHFVESTVDIFYATAKGKNITIKVDFSSADPHLIHIT